MRGLWVLKDLYGSQAAKRRGTSLKPHQPTVLVNSAPVLFQEKKMGATMQVVRGQRSRRGTYKILGIASQIQNLPRSSTLGSCPFLPGQTSYFCINSSCVCNI